MAIQRSRVVTGPLNHRQREILAYVAAGKTHKWTAEKIGVSRVCVSENMRIAVRKLNCANASEAIGRWGEYRSYRRAAQMLEGASKGHPLDRVEQHVNHVLAGLAKILRDRADLLIPPQ
jgi:DNA-binding CsgD family transcriptional regulator